MIQNLSILLAVIFVPSILLAHHFGYRKCYEEFQNERERYERLTDEDVDRIEHWHKDYVYNTGSYPANWDVIRKLKRKV